MLEGKGLTREQEDNWRAIVRYMHWMNWLRHTRMAILRDYPAPRVVP